jgi:hypothetical protein
MATPIAHKGVIAGAQAEAMTLIDILLILILQNRPGIILQKNKVWR